MHISEKSIPEIQEILQEIYYQKPLSFSSINFLGDIFDKKKPNPIEIDFVTKFLYDMQKNCLVTICTGNHDDSSNIISALNYTQHFGIKSVRHHGTVQIGEKTLYLGHHFVDKSDKYFKDDRFKVDELSAKYDLCFTGHDHKFKQYAPNFFNLGSILRVNFGEVEYGIPKYAEICPETLERTILDIKSAIPMIEVDSIKKALKIDSHTKLRLVFRSFEEYIKNVNKLPELHKKFHTFKVKHDYAQKMEKKPTVTHKGRDFSEIFTKFLKETVKNKAVKKLIEENL